jgi:hypothetical protein
MFRIVRATGFFLLCVSLPTAVGAQAFETLGTRAAGMGGAFVAVADDASAIYWNPGGLASGAFFSLLVDRSTSEVTPDHPSDGASRSAAIIGLSTPPLGLGYYGSVKHRPSASALQQSRMEAEKTGNRTTSESTRSSRITRA